MQPEGFDDALGASYRLLDRLGEGATGEVWRAVHRRTGETVATKLLRREHLADRDLVGRFVQERSVLIGLRHPAVVAVRDLVVEGERLAIVMEYVDGGSLREVLQARGTLPPALAVDVAAAVLDGLASAHERDVVHRDVKPDNVLLARAWEPVEPGSVKLVDFGIARIITDRRRSTTGLLGTPEYMSPELLTRGHADAAADVYGVGIMLYELLAGRTPFAGPGNEYTIAHRHVTAEPPPLPLPERLGTQLAALLEKDPARRPSAAAAAAALRAARPALCGPTALAPQPCPDDFDSARGPVTVVRGLTPTAAPVPVAADAEDGAADLDLGTPGQVTTVRPMQRRPVTEEDRAEPPGPATQAPVPGWKDPKLVAVVVAALVVLVGVVLLVTLRGDDAPVAEEPAEPPTPVAAGPGDAQITDPALPTGLTVTRAATWDPEQEMVALTLTYAADRAPLSGPVLEVLANPDGQCPPSVAWEGVEQQRNLPTVSQITVDCGWSLDVATIEPGQSTTLDATFPLPLEVEEGADADAALQEWLTGVSRSTQAAALDPDLATTVDSYPAQRLLGIQVEVPSDTVTQRVLPVDIYPVWPAGTDQVNPLHSTGTAGDATETLTAVAGGTEGITFGSGCSSSLRISGLTITPLNFVEDCTVEVDLGNFLAVPSNTFSVTTRDG